MAYISLGNRDLRLTWSMARGITLHDEMKTQPVPFIYKKRLQNASKAERAEAATLSADRTFEKLRPVEKPDERRPTQSTAADGRQGLIPKCQTRCHVHPSDLHSRLRRNR